MFASRSHGSSQGFGAEIQFRTPFGYMFEHLAKDKDRLLPSGKKTVGALQDLGDAMGDPGDQSSPHTELDSTMPAIMTYFGQFIDHDITANTDRDGEMINQIADGEGLTPVPMDDIIGPEPKLVNGRRPQLDLDSMYGDGPQLLPGGAGTQADELYDHDLLMRVQRGHGYVDLPRRKRNARIADMRNDENIIVGQFHTAMLMFHNAVAESLSATNNDGPTPAHRYARARRLVRWCYQYMVVNEYLPTVCDPAVVEDVMMNGPRSFGPGVHATPLYMPIEFSVAGFRFAHSMIRPFYRLNDKTVLTILEILGPAKTVSKADKDPLEKDGDDFHMKPDRVVHWSNFVPKLHGAHQPARKIDPLLAKGLFQLDKGIGDERKADNLKNLARSNLLRGYHLRVPTAQACAEAMGVSCMRDKDIADDKKIGKAIEAGGFAKKTPLWYYVLQEAKVQQGGNRLGALGSRIVAETLIGLIKNDPNSYLNSRHAEAVTDHGIELWTNRRDRVRISTLADMIEYCGAPR